MRLTSLLSLHGVHFAGITLPGQIVLGQFGQKAAGFAGYHFALTFAACCQCKSERFVGAGDADVGEAALLFDLIFFGAVAVWKNFFFHTNEEDVRKL